MLTFVGEGYSPAFTDNYRRIAGRLSAGEGITLVSGPDDICAPLLTGEGAHCLGPSVAARDAKAAEAIARLLDEPIEPGSTVRPDTEMLRRLREKFAGGEIRKACHGCEWEELCSHIADGGYERTLVNRN